MKKSRIVHSIVCLATSAVLLLSHVSAGDGALLSQLDTALTRASSYESAGNYAMAYFEAARYADLAQTLAESGELPRKTSDRAAAWRDSLHYEPEVYFSVPSDKGIFFGGDGIYAKGASAVKISIPYGCYAEDYYQMIPSVPGEIMISVSLELTNEKAMRDIAFGKKDDYIADNLRQISRMEGRVYFAFCPSVNTMRNTRTIAQSFVSAYRHVADLARRYAPNVKLMLTLGDVREPGDGTISKFYPGDGYVDALGVELCHTYNKSYPSSPEAAFDGRGVYYDPVYSVRRLAAEVEEISGTTLPLVIDGCSFPWAGTAGTDDWQDEMKRFYSLIPAVCPETVAVLYSNESSSAGICNLRQNSRAMALYEECLDLPWYINHESKGGIASAVPFSDIESVPAGIQTQMYLFCGGRFSGEEMKVFLDGREVIGQVVIFSEGTHQLKIRVTNDAFPAKLEYDVTVSGGSITATPVEGKYDLNGNGYMDFGDVEFVLAHIAGWGVDVGDRNLDLNGDGRVNIKDANVVRAEIGT